jgi:hypothetical protein
MSWLNATHLLLGIGGPTWGIVAFTGVYVLLLIWLILLPSRLLDEPVGRPWWKSSRLWAIVIAVIQILVYVGLG